MSAALTRAIRRAAAAAGGDSNDEEIGALREALDQACRLLHVDPETGASTRPRKPIAPKSEKRKAVEHERWRAKADYLAEHQFCEMAGSMCVGRPLDIHERLSRGRGGSITDPANFVALCRPCHDHVTRNPTWAEDNGWALKTGATQ